MFIDDTIAAIATAPGEGGIGIIRISGEKSLEVAQSIFKSMSGKLIKEYNTRTLIYGNIVDNENTIDEVLYPNSSIFEADSLSSDSLHHYLIHLWLNNIPLYIPQFPYP